MCVLHYDAPSRELALEAARRAGVTSDRVVEMVEGHGMTRAPGAVLAAAVALPVFVLTGPAGAQNGTAPPCPPAVAPRGHHPRLRRRGRRWAAHRHAHDRPRGARSRWSGAGREVHRARRSAESGHRDQSVVQHRHAGAGPGVGHVGALRRQRAVQLHRERSGHAPAQTREGGDLPRGATGARAFADSYTFALRTGKNADLRPVQVRLRGVKRARLPGRGARVQRATIALRRGDPGLSRGEFRRLRAAGWRFRISNIDEHEHPLQR